MCKYKALDEELIVIISEIKSFKIAVVNINGAEINKLSLILYKFSCNYYSCKTTIRVGADNSFNI